MSDGVYTKVPRDHPNWDAINRACKQIIEEGDKEIIAQLQSLADESGGTSFYIAQEKAFAPGIVGDWPDVIPHPTNPHGRLVKASKLPLTALLAATCGECDEYHCGAVCPRKVIRCTIERAIAADVEVVGVGEQR